MAQTTGATTARAGTVAISPDNSTWTDISGFSNAVTGTQQDRTSGEVYTFDGDKAIVGVGKREPDEAAIKIVYSEGGSEPFAVLRSIFENATPYYVRYTVKAATTGNLRFTSDSGYIISCPYPEVDSTSGDPVTVEFTFKTPGWTQASVP